MKSSYKSSRGLGLYLGGAAAARAGDEMSGPALLLLGFAVTGRPAPGPAAGRHPGRLRHRHHRDRYALRPRTCSPARARRTRRVPPAGAGPVRKDGSHGPFGKMTYACRHAMRAECCVVAGRLGRSYSALVSRPSGMGGLFRAPDGPDPRGTWGRTMELIDGGAGQARILT